MKYLLICDSQHTDEIKIVMRPFVVKAQFGCISEGLKKLILFSIYVSHVSSNRYLCYTPGAFPIASHEQSICVDSVKRDYDLYWNRGFFHKLVMSFLRSILINFVKIIYFLCGSPLKQPFIFVRGIMHSDTMSRAGLSLMHA